MNSETVCSLGQKGQNGLATHVSTA